MIQLIHNLLPLIKICCIWHAINDLLSYLSVNIQRPILDHFGVVKVICLRVDALLFHDWAQKCVYLNLLLCPFKTLDNRQDFNPFFFFKCSLFCIRNNKLIEGSKLNLWWGSVFWRLRRSLNVTFKHLEFDFVFWGFVDTGEVVLVVTLFNTFFWFIFFNAIYRKIFFDYFHFWFLGV